MRHSFRLLLAIAATSALVAVAPLTASAQTIPDVLGTTILNDTLSQLGINQIGLPQTTPDQNSGATTQDETTTAQPVVHPLGYYCKAESKRHVAGKKGTPFSQCVTAMGKLRKGTSASAAAACRPLSRKHFPGMKKTPYAACVAGGKRLLADQQPA